MCNRCMKAVAVLAVLVISLISVSSAAGPRAMPDLYAGKCGVELSVPAPGILANDVKSVNPLQVLDPDKISIDPKYGTLTVYEDGSFVYEPAQNIPQGTYISFKYRATDGAKKTGHVLVKIQMSCVCRGIAPDVTVCPGKKVTPNLLMSEGARCTGCRDVTPKFDLRKIPSKPVAGTCYPYTVSCPGCGLVTGHVCFAGPCTITSVPFTVGPDVTPTAEEILADGLVGCSDCDATPVISNIILVDNHWEYTITCQSECGSATGKGIVNIGECTITPPLVFPIMDCPAELPTADQVIELSGLSCGCGPEAIISDIQWVSQPEEDVWTGEYTYTCTSADGTAISDKGQFETAQDCN